MRESVFKLPFKYRGNKSSLSNLFSCPVLMPSVGFEEAFLMFQLKSKSILFPLAFVEATVLAEPLFAKLCLQPAAQVHRVQLHRAAQDVEDRNPNSLCLRRSQVSRAVSETLRPPVIPPPPTPPTSPPPTSRPPRRHPEFRSGGGFQLTVTPPLSSRRAALVHLSSCSTSVNFACVLFL